MKQLSAPERLKNIISKNTPVAPLTTWGVGGSVAVMITPRDRAELISSVRWLYSEESSFCVLGGGSNVLVADGLIDTPILHTSELNGIETSIKDGYVYLCCGTGVLLKTLFAVAISSGWSGLEFAAGIPGTVGGAVAGNAGTAHGSISSVIDEIETVREDGSVSKWSSSDVKWGYRKCSLVEDNRSIISSVTLKLKLSDRNSVAAMAKLSAGSRRTQPIGVKTAGCVFKNTPHESAGKLLDDSGCKGLSVGGARVSQKHANFIENYSNSKASDIVELMMLCRERVRNKFNISLQLEIKQLGFPANFLDG